METWHVCACFVPRPRGVDCHTFRDPTGPDFLVCKVGIVTSAAGRAVLGLRPLSLEGVLATSGSCWRNHDGIN